MYEEIFAGLSTPDPTAVLSPLIGEYHREMVLVRDINFYSMCEHRLLPFAGTPHVAYIPSEQGSIVGLSTLVRLVHVIAARPQVQERITSEVADTIVGALEPDGVLVLIEAEHLCMSMGGVKIARAKTVTSAARGLMRSKSATRNAALAFVNHG